MPFRDICRRIEEHDATVRRVEHKPNRERQPADAPADQNQASLLAGHCALNPIPSLKFSIIASIWLRDAFTYSTAIVAVLSKIKGAAQGQMRAFRPQRRSAE